VEKSTEAKDESLNPTTSPLNSGQVNRQVYGHLDLVESHTQHLWTQVNGRYACYNRIETTTRSIKNRLEHLFPWLFITAAPLSLKGIVRGILEDILPRCLICPPSIDSLSASSKPETESRKAFRMNCDNTWDLFVEAERRDQLR